MVKPARLLEKMRLHPHDWRIEEVVKVAQAYGFGVRQGKGSHVNIWHDALPDILTVPARRPIKPKYIQLLVKMIDRVEKR